MSEPAADAEVFVGRARELAELRGLPLTARHGAGRLVAVEGEAGIGKTRLVEEFFKVARSQRVPVRIGRARRRERDPAVAAAAAERFGTAAAERVPRARVLAELPGGRRDLRGLRRPPSRRRRRCPRRRWSWPLPPATRWRSSRLSGPATWP
ncbi:MAG: ATP-binding protein [Frankiaceae bacterium]